MSSSLSFLCMKKMIPNMTLDQMEEIQKIFITNIDDCDKHRFSNEYSKTPIVCNVCSQHEYCKSKKDDYKKCIKCNEYSCRNCTGSCLTSVGWRSVCLKCIGKKIKMCMICDVNPRHVISCYDYGRSFYAVVYLTCHECERKGCINCIGKSKCYANC